MLVYSPRRDRVQKLTRHGRRPDISLVLELVMRRHRYRALGKQDAHPSRQKAAAIKLPGPSGRHVDDLLNIGDDDDGLAEGCEEHLEYGALDLGGLGGKPAETLPGVFGILDEVQGIAEELPAGLPRVGDAWEGFGKGPPVEEGQEYCDEGAAECNAIF